MEENNHDGCQTMDQPEHTQIFNADFLFIAISAVVVHTYAMLYTYLFVL